MKPMGTGNVPGAHGHIFCSGLMTYQQNRSLRAVKKKVDGVKGNLQERKDKVLQVFKVKKPSAFVNQAPSGLQLLPSSRHPFPRVGFKDGDPSLEERGDLRLDATDG